VILFSTAALRESDWVRKEAAILSWRRELQEDFVLIPVLLEGTRPENLEEGLYRVLRISRGQCVRDAADAQQIVDDVALGLGPSQEKTLTPFERLEGVLTKILERQATADTLEDAWNSLQGANKPQWQRDSERRFASALARFLLRDRRRALEHLKTVLDRIRPRVDKAAAEELLKYLACLWVDAEAAGGVPASAHRGGMVGLNGNYLPGFTAKRYGERAWPLSDKWRLVPVDTSQRTPEDILEAIRAAFRPRGVQVRVAVIDRRIRQHQEPVLVLIPSPQDRSQLPDETLLTELRRRYPNLIYMIGTGERVPDWTPPQVEILIPPLDPDVEIDQLFALDDLKAFINRVHGNL